MSKQSNIKSLKFCFTTQKLSKNKNISASEKFQDYSWIQESQPQHTELG